MGRLHLAFVLDFFQPSQQPYRLIEQITQECYRPLVDIFNSHANAAFTISMAQSLANLLEEGDGKDVLQALRRAVEHDTIELVHTAAYRPILPLLPDQEVRRQIELDVQLKSDRFGLTARAGVLLPELAYHDKLVPLLQNLGFHWTLVDDSVMGANAVAVPDRQLLCVSGFAVLMRSSFWSDQIRNSGPDGQHLTGREFVDLLRREAHASENDCYKIVALSAETFGHHINYYDETFLRDMLLSLECCPSVRLCRVSELLDTKTLEKAEKHPESARDFQYFPPCSWGTLARDYEHGAPYPHWCYRGNPVHEKLWELTNLILECSQRIDFSNAANRDLRESLDRAFYSSQYYWASFLFWKPDLIYQGIDRQMRVLYRCVEVTHSPRLLRQGGQLYADLMWEIHKHSLQVSPP